jgi:chlorite dismutase
MLHQLFAVDHAALRQADQAERRSLCDEAHSAFSAIAPQDGQGWTAVAPVIGSVAEVMIVHVRPTLDGIGEAQRQMRRTGVHDLLHPVYSFLSITEAGLYHITAQLAKDAAARGGAVGDETYREALDARMRAELESPHVRRRLFPTPPPEMPYICFYPMSKRRDASQNWYGLSLEERSQLMYAHGMTGRGYAGRIVQIISGAIGLDAWEWGVTLFAKDPLDFKRIVTDMRFDEVSAKYAEFGDFYVGKLSTPEAWLSDVLAPDRAP